MRNKIVTKLLTCTLSAGLILSGCGNTSVSSTTTEVTDSANTSESTTAIGQTVSGPAREDITVNETIENNEDGEHAIEAAGEDASYSNVEVIKTGDSDEGDEADFYGDNAAIFAMKCISILMVLMPMVYSAMVKVPLSTFQIHTSLQQAIVLAVL